MAGIKVVHVRTRGSAALTESWGTPAYDVLERIRRSAARQAGKLRGLAVSSMDDGRRSRDPHGCRIGVPGFEAQTWFGLLAPAGTPPEIVKRLNADVLRRSPNRTSRTSLLRWG